MNKTVTASLASLVFHIEEQAYFKLQAYLEEIKMRLGDDVDANEIMQDIENRIAELFLERTFERREVIDEADVSAIIDIMGEPMDYGDTEQTSTSSSNENNDSSGTSKKLYRDEDNNMLGGVCSGLANYLNLDTTWVRLAFLLLVILGGSGGILYLILWIILPKATTTAEKLEMKGKPVNAQSIKDHLKNFQKEVEGLGKNEHTQKIKSASDQFIKTFGKVFGALCLFGGAIILVALINWIFTKDFIISLTNTGVNEFGMSDLMAVCLTYWQHIGVTIGIICILIGPIVGLFYLGARLFFNIKTKIKAIGLAAVSISIIGGVILTVTGINIARDRSTKHKEDDTTIITTTSNLLTIDISDDIHFSDDYSHVDNYFFELLKQENGSVIVGWPKMDIIPTDRDEFELIVMKSSQGRNKREAIYNAKGIRYPVKLQGDHLIVSPYFSFDAETKFKDQDVNVILKVPNGKSVQLSDRMARVLHQVDNEFSLPQHKLAGKTWVMKQNTLMVPQH